MATKSETIAISDYAAQLRARLWGAERLRTAAALVLLLTCGAMTAVRDFLSLKYRGGWTVAGLGLMVALAGAEVAWYLLLRQAHRRSGRLPTFLVASGVVLEANFPTVGVILLTANPSVGPFRALAAPMVTLYFLFIILASLRMRPWVCLVSGASAFGGYLVVALSTYAVFPEHRSLAQLGLTFPISTSVALLFAGILGALVSRQILAGVSHAIASSLKQQKLEDDLAIAKRIQQSLLPAGPPCAEGFDVAGRTDPADQTGGDSFDWLSLPGGRTVVTLADVTGHGIGPALLAANLHAYVHSIFSVDGRLGDCMDSLNRHIAGDLSEGRFVTFAAVLLHSPAGLVEMLSAGHGPILLYQSARSCVTELGAQGLPLGILDEASFEESRCLEMAPGDMLVLITDGFFEQANAAGEQFGIERLKGSILRHVAGEAKDMIVGLYEDVRVFAEGAPQADDLTVVVIRRTK